jgi:hypothetical protein
MWAWPRGRQRSGSVFRVEAEVVGRLAQVVADRGMSDLVDDLARLGCGVVAPDRGGALLADDETVLEGRACSLKLSRCEPDDDDAAGADRYCYGARTVAVPRSANAD